MLGSIKRWMNSGPSGPDWRSVSAWAKQHGHEFKRVRDGEGFAIEGALSAMSADAVAADRHRAAPKSVLPPVMWRLEWGPPQRTYIASREMRIRADVELHSALQMLVLSRGLLEQLESETFDLYTETMQTSIDSSTPEEMRWLAMFPKVELGAIKPVRAHFGAVASVPSLGVKWLSGPLGIQLAQARIGLLGGLAPFVLMTQRNRVQMRVECEFPGAREVEQGVTLFETAVRQALMLRAEKTASGSAGAAADWADNPGRG
jgi:hypothetical protein